MNTILNEIYFKKRKKLLIIFSTFLIAILAISMINIVSATDKLIDKGSFTIKGEKVYYDTLLQSNKKSISIDFYSAKYNKKKPQNYFYNVYRLSKNKNTITSTREYNGKITLLKKYTTTKSVKNFYDSNYKKYIIKQEKTRLKKFLNK